MGWQKPLCACGSSPQRGRSLPLRSVTKTASRIRSTCKWKGRRHFVLFRLGGQLSLQKQRSSFLNPFRRQGSPLRRSRCWIAPCPMAEDTGCKNSRRQTRRRLCRRMAVGRTADSGTRPCTGAAVRCDQLCCRPVYRRRTCGIWAGYTGCSAQGPHTGARPCVLLCAGGGWMLSVPRRGRFDLPGGSLCAGYHCSLGQGIGHCILDRPAGADCWSVFIERLSFVFDKFRPNDVS